MTDRSWKVFLILTAVITGITVWFDWRITTGFLLGTLEAYLQYRHIETFWNRVMDSGSSYKSTGILQRFMHLGMITLVLLIGAVFRNVFNIFGCAAGMLMIKFTIVLETLICKRKE